MAGHRVVLLTGSRENAGLTSQGAGIYDLSADGATLVLNAVEYLTGKAGAPVVAPSEATISLSRDASGITVEFTGTLQSAPSVSGPWTDEAGAGSPLVIEPSGDGKFYRAVE